jgi:hypothetical protein
MPGSRYYKLSGTAVDFQDWWAVAEEIQYCSTFCYKKKLLLLLADWKEWMEENSTLLLLAEEEQIAFAALIAKVQSAKPLGLKPIAKEILSWMTAYADH